MAHLHVTIHWMTLMLVLTTSAQAEVVTLNRLNPSYGSQPLTSSVSQATSSSSSAALSAFTDVFAGFTDVASAIGPGESGMTKYEDKVVFNRFQFNDPANGIHFVDPSVPITAVTYTIEEGGTVHREVADPFITQFNGHDIFLQDGKRVDCQINEGKNGGVCSGELLHPEFTQFLSGTQTVTGTMTITRPTTYTATAFPVATFTTTASSAHGLSSSLFSGVLMGVVLGVVMTL
ncbi:hypothetical protein BJ165DRAFT_862726 [Panaeolus papilionaceus]|nr:hypothetical protein BJ165DRAFT_862726 [Panaeolus papilionaceus]